MDKITGNIVSLACIIGAVAALFASDSYAWGWFLFVGLLTAKV